MKELVRTNNAALIAFVESLLKDLGAGYFIADRAISGAEGSIGLFPKRILVDDDDFRRARDLLIQAGLADELRPDERT